MEDHEVSKLIQIVESDKTNGELSNNAKALLLKYIAALDKIFDIKTKAFDEKEKNK